MRWCLLLLSVITTLSLFAADDMGRQDIDEEDSDRKAFTSAREDAAEWRRGRAKATAYEKDDAGARVYLEEAKRLLAEGSNIFARWEAEDGFEEHPYSSLGPELLHLAFEGYAQGSRIGAMREKLLQIWLYYPDYPRMGELMARALQVAEFEQEFQTLINLDAEEPGKVISIDGRAWWADTQTVRLFRFIAQHGDKESLAPRAALGMARAKLIQGDKEAVIEARRAYEDFLEDWPNNELTFPAITEYALSYLVSYRGAHYDLGALVYAQAIIDQAELETRGDAQRIATIQAYRKRIRSWLQDRDLVVARWFRNRGEPAAFAWLTMPAGLLSWEDGARYFFKEVIKRDPSSAQSRNAERELAELPKGR